MDKFRLTRATGSGFHMTFNNNVTVSVQFGEGTYSDKGANTAEVAVFRDDDWYLLGINELVLANGSDVNAQCSPDIVAVIMEKARQIK